MANYRAIAAISEVLIGIIRDGYPRDPQGQGMGFPPGLEVSSYQPRNFETPMDEGFSVLLMRATINTTVRSSSPRRAPDGRRFRPSLPLDLHYVVTPWAQEAATQQRMLGWVMRMFEDLGTLSASHLNHYVADNDIFAADDALELICDPPALNDYLSLWERLRSLPPSASYTVRMVQIDSDVGFDDGPPVQTRAFDVGEVSV
jgi:hypothetical protein